MKLKFSKPKGNRVKTGLRGFEDVNYGWSYNCTLKIWTKEINRIHHYSCLQECSSVKAFRRMLKDVPAGVLFKFTSRWNEGNYVYGYGSKSN